MNQIVQSQLVSVLLFKVKIFLWLSLLLSSLAVAHCQEGCKQHPKKIVFECCWIFLSNKMSAEGSKLSANSLVFLKNHTVSYVLEKKLYKYRMGGIFFWKIILIFMQRHFCWWQMFFSLFGSISLLFKDISGLKVTLA